MSSFARLDFRVNSLHRCRNNRLLPFSPPPLVPAYGGIIGSRQGECTAVLSRHGAVKSSLNKQVRDSWSNSHAQFGFRCVDARSV